MEFLDSIKSYFQRKKQEAYCQNCGNELTERGGDIAGSGRIYCPGYNGVETACALKATFNGLETGMMMFMNFYEPAQVQKAIRRKELTHFGPLEQVVL